MYADKGLHLESVINARDARMRTIRVLLLNVVPHDEAYGWEAKRVYTVNTATRTLEVRNVVAIEQLTPMLEKEAPT